MKKSLSFLAAMLFAGIASAQTYNTLVHFVPGGAELVAESGATVTIKSGASLTVDSGATVSISSSVTSNSLALTYGLSAATGVFSGAVTVGGALGVTGALTGTSGAFSTTLAALGNVTLGAANYKSTMTAASGAWAITGAMTSLAGWSGTTLSGSGAITGATTLAVQGANYFGSNANATVSTFTAAGALAVHASVTAPIVTVTNYLDLTPITKAAILALPGGAVGRTWGCSDCTAVLHCVSTGTAVGAQTKVTDRAVACD